MGLTTDPKDPRLERGSDDTGPVPMNEAYLVLSEEERAKGFVRPVRRAYVHVGAPGPRYPLRDLTDEERERFDADRYSYVKYEDYPRDAEHGNTLGKLWTQETLDAVGKGCGAVTTMALALAETYAREPGFYGATYCASCRMHRPVGVDGEFVWEGTDERVGT